MRGSFVTLVLAAAALAGPEVRAQQAIAEPYLFTPPGCGGSSPFSDVPAADAYCPWIKQFGADGISQGCGGGKFCPDQPVTRKQLALLMERAMRGTASWEPWRGAYRRTLIVNPVPGNPQASGARLLAVFAEITNAAYGNFYLVKLEPGSYDIGSQALDLKPFVDVEGSGVEKTAIHGSRNGALVFGADDVELRSLTIWNSNADNPIGLALAGDSIRLTDVRVITSGELSSMGIQEAGAGAVLTRVSTLNVAWQPGSSSYGVTVGGSAVLRDCQIEVTAQSGTARGIVAFSGAPLFERVRVVIDGATQIAMRIDTGANATLLQVDLLPKYGSGTTGIAMFDGTATIVDSRIEVEAAGTVGIACSASTSHTVTIRNSRIGGDDALTGDPQCTFRIANSQMWGDIVDNGSPVTCFGTYDYSYNTKFCS